MKKLLYGAVACLLCAAAAASLAGCSGYDIEGQVPYGEEGSMLFFGVNYNETYSKSEGVTVSVNFAHETVAEENAVYAIYAGNDGSYRSVMSLPVDFAVSDAYNAKSITAEEIVPGVVAYTCKFPQDAVALTLPADLFEGESGTFRLVLASGTTDFADGGDLCDYVFDYTVSGDTISLENGI